METNFQQDIPLSLAISAHSGTSFVPEKHDHTIAKALAVAGVAQEVTA